MKVLVSLLLLLLSCWSVHLQHASEGASTATSPCAISQVRLYSIIREIFGGDLNVFVNCLSFEKSGALRLGVVSGLNETGGPGLRMVLQCVEGVIAAMPSELLPVNSSMNTTACVECMDTSVATEICSAACLSPCERCYGSPTDCSRCIACTASEVEYCYLSEESVTPLNPNCSASCIAVTATEPSTDRFNFCDCPEGHYKQLCQYPPAQLDEGEIPSTCSLLELEEEEEFRCDEGGVNFRCVASCEENELEFKGFEFNEELGFCFACGLEYCLDCSGNKTAGFQCNRCLYETELYEHECFACPKSLVVRNAEEQELELEEEREDQRKRQMELAITLPILSVLVIVFFLGMSLFAHYRYPHVNPQGHKRHRTKPEDLDNLTIEDTTTNDVEPPLAPADIWRSRPTIRFR